MSAEKFQMRSVVAALVGVTVLSLSMQTTAFADEDDEISPVCRAKPWLPVCDPPETPNPPPQLPFPCDLTAPGCPWWYLR